MTGEDFGEVRYRRQFAEHALIKLMSQFLASFFAQQVRSPNIAYKYEVTREDQPRRVRASRVVEQRPRNVFQRVAGSMNCLQPHDSHHDFIAILHNMICIWWRPVFAAHARCMNRQAIAEPVLHFPRTAHEVSMHVRFENVLDVQPFSLGDLEKSVNVTSRQVKWVN